MQTGYAFDTTARTFDTDGRMHISRSHISKANVCPYFGKEIPGYEQLGLDPQKIYKLLRSPEELKKGAHTFARIPILSKHIPITAATPSRDLWVGTIGSDVEFNDPYLDADTAIWVLPAIAGIETDTVREFSSAYHYTPVMIPGKYKGEDYDGIMTEIRGNHLALVEAGRAGPDVLAADSKPRELEMKMTKLGKALFVTLGTAFPKLAQDSSLPTLVGRASKKTFNKADVTTKLLAMDSEIPADKLGIVMDALLDVEPEAKEPKKKPAEDEDDDDLDDLGEDEDHPKDCDCKDCKKPAQDEDDEDDKKKKKPAMDSKLRLKLAMDSYKVELRETNDARIAVRPVVGDVIGMDSAVEVYGFALDHMKVDRKDVTGVPALKALFNLAHARTAPASPRVAMDSASLATQFPGATRFRQA